MKRRKEKKWRLGQEIGKREQRREEKIVMEKIYPVTLGKKASREEN